MIRDYRGVSPSELYRAIVTAFDADKYTYIITGTPGPTGKTWLWRQLKEFGLNAFEITQLIYHLVDFRSHFRQIEVLPKLFFEDDKKEVHVKYKKDNYMMVDTIQRVVVIVLNEPLTLERYGE